MVERLKLDCEEHWGLGSLRDTDNTVTEDTELIRRIIAGEVDAFEGLVGKYKDKVFRIVGKYVSGSEVDEVAQTVFIRAFESLPTYREEAPFEHWISKVAARTCFDFWRHSRRQKEVTITAEHLTLLDGNASFDAFRIDEKDRRLKEVLAWAMGKLSADEKMVTTLLYFEGYSEKEAAEILGWKVSNVKGRAFKARRNLETALTKVMKEGVL